MHLLLVTEPIGHIKDAIMFVADETFSGGLFSSFRSLKLHAATDEDAEDVIIHYSQGSGLVESLKICSSSLTDKGLFNLLDHLSSLQELELTSCNEITEEGLNAALPIKLTRLVILDCIHVADQSVAYLARNLPCLQYFEIQVIIITEYGILSLLLYAQDSRDDEI